MLISAFFRTFSKETEPRISIPHPARERLSRGLWLVALWLGSREVDCRAIGRAMLGTEHESGLCEKQRSHSLVMAAATTVLRPGKMAACTPRAGPDWVKHYRMNSCSIPNPQTSDWFPDSIPASFHPPEQVSLRVHGCSVLDTSQVLSNHVINSQADGRRVREKGGCFI